MIICDKLSDFMQLNCLALDLQLLSLHILAFYAKAAQYQLVIDYPVLKSFL